jgi:hypothetical protein
MERMPSGPAGPALPATSPYDIYSATLFLYTGKSPVQTGVSASTVDPASVAVIRGLVSKRDGSPLQGAAVRVVGHPEFGQTTSQANGAFDLVINGGGQTIVQTELSGYLTAQRTVSAPARRYVVTPATVTVQRDATVATVDLAAGTMQVAVGGAVQDQSGRRQPIVMFPAGTQATMVMPGGATAPLTKLSVRLTEFTVGANGPQAMPGMLVRTDDGSGSETFIPVNRSSFSVGSAATTFSVQGTGAEGQMTVK